MPGIAVIAAPSDLGLRPTGVSELPQALRRAGLLGGMQAVVDAGTVDVPAHEGVRDRATGVRNARGIRELSRRLARRVEESLGSGRFTLVLGGDCSILLGIMAALKRRGRYGLLFMDGHADFYSPESEPNGEAASMELALITGRGPQLLDAGVGQPLVRDEDVVAFGMRDRESARAHGSPDVRDSGIRVLDCTAVQERGAVEAARDAVSALEASGAAGFWVHLDADVLSDNAMPAVDYRMPGGLSPAELTGALTVALRSRKAVGMDITIYNPSLDDEPLTAGRVLAEAVTHAFEAAA